MTKTLILHIGTPKTGTTTIQGGLAQNAEKLEQAGVFYPCRRGAPYIQNDQHVPLVAGICGHDLWWLAPAKRATKDRALDALLADIAASPAQTVILSSEAFCESGMMTPDKVRMVRDSFAGFDIRIVVYIRRQDHYLLSQYQQNIRAGITAPLQPEAFRHFKGVFYRPRLEPWREIFGADNMTVRPFDSRFWTGGTLFTDFLDVIGTPPEGMAPAPTTNEGLDLHALETVRRFNQFLKTRTTLSPPQQHELRGRVIGALRARPAAAAQPQKMRLSSEQANRIRDALRDDNAWCLDGSGIDVDDFFPETPPGVEARLRPDPLEPGLLQYTIAALAAELAGLPAPFAKAPQDSPT